MWTCTDLGLISLNSVAWKYRGSILSVLRNVYTRLKWAGGTKRRLEYVTRPPREVIEWRREHDRGR